MGVCMKLHDCVSQRSHFLQEQIQYETQLFVYLSGTNCKLFKMMVRLYVKCIITAM